MTTRNQVSAKRLKRRYGFTVLLSGFLLIAAMSAYTYAMFLSERNKQNIKLQRQGEELQFILNERINIARSHVTSMRKTIERSLANPSLIDTNFFQRHSNLANSPFPDAPWDTLPQKFDQQLGSIFIDTTLPTSQISIKEINAIMTTLAQVAATHDQHKMFQWSYFYSHDKSWVQIFPRFAKSDAFQLNKATNMHDTINAILDDQNTAPLRKAGPILNLAKTSIWTSPYLDFAGKGMMVSLLAPVYDNEDFKGVVGTDITLAFLDTLLHEHSIQLSRTLIIDNQNFLLADSDDSIKTFNKNLRITDVLPKFDQSKQIGSSEWLSFPLHETPWMLLVHVPADVANSNLFLVLRPFIAISMLLLLAFFALAWIQNRRYTTPALQLAEYVDVVASHPNQSFPKVPNIWVHWFESVRNTSNERRELLKKTLEHADQLEAKVNERTEALSRANIELENAIQTLKNTQLQLVRSEKLASLGNMVAGISHELNTPLGNALLMISTLRDFQHELESQLEGQSLRRSDLTQFLARLAETCDLTLKNIQIASNLVQHFKEVDVNPTDERLSAVNLNELVACTLIQMESNFTAGMCQIVNKLPVDIVMNTYPEALEQIIRNLISNACNHAFEGRSDGVIELSAAILNNKMITISVSDNGRGITQETLGKIFDPFFTTKMGQGGTGLGLHIVLNTVENVLGGNINVISSEKGTIFTLTLPINTPQIPSNHEG
nr:ATP-binding protein [uncultured Undibacterium sp.]